MQLSTSSSRPELSNDTSSENIIAEHNQHRSILRSHNEEHDWRYALNKHDTGQGKRVMNHVELTTLDTLTRETVPKRADRVDIGLRCKTLPFAYSAGIPIC